MGPDLRDVKRIETIVPGLFRGHYLDFKPPGRVIALRDRFIKVAGNAVRIDASHALRFLAGEIPYALLGLEMELYPEVLAFFVVPHVGVTAVTVHVTVTMGRAAVGKENGNLMDGFGSQ